MLTMVKTRKTKKQPKEYPVSKKDFHKLLEKASKPIKPDLKKS